MVALPCSWAGLVLFHVSQDTNSCAFLLSWSLPVFQSHVVAILLLLIFATLRLDSNVVTASLVLSLEMFRLKPWLSHAASARSPDCLFVGLFRHRWSYSQFVRMRSPLKRLFGLGRRIWRILSDTKPACCEQGEVCNVGRNLCLLARGILRVQDLCTLRLPVSELPEPCPSDKHRVFGKEKSNPCTACSLHCSCFFWFQFYIKDPKWYCNPQKELQWRL